MESFSALLAICVGNSPHKGQWHRALMFSLVYTRVNGWVSNGETGDLRPYRAHYDVTVIVVTHLLQCAEYVMFPLEAYVMGKVINSVLFVH